MSAFATLLRREYWEHRGAFVWTPVVVGAVFTALTLIGLATATIKGPKAGLVIDGVPVAELVGRLGPDELAKLGDGIDVALTAIWGLIQVALYFVVLFYLLGALFDERRDRSVLFWKSLPVSDATTVLSKAATAVFVAPLIAWAASVAFGLVFLVVLSGYALSLGLDPFTTIWGPASPLAVFAATFVMVPLTALWSLPMVGWMLLCSAFAGQRPFLWAVGLPVLVGLTLAWLGILSVFRDGAEFYWQHVFLRLTTSVFPGSWLWFDGTAGGIALEPGKGNLSAMMLSSVESLVTNPATWIGTIIGAALLVGAIELRRRVSE
jgi:ABC-2 type transport system permease protein